MTAVSVQPMSPDIDPEMASGTPVRHSGQGVALCLGMLKGGLLASHLLAGLAILGAGLVRGPEGAASAAVAGALVIAFFASGQAVQMVAGELANGTAMVLVMASYLLRVTLLGLVLVAAMHFQSELDSVFVPWAFVTGAVTALLGWIGGVLTTSSRQRVFVYDNDFDSFRRVGGSK